MPVMPAGQPEVDSVTAALKPFTGVTVTVDVPLPPAATIAGVAARVKLDCPADASVNVPNGCHEPDLYAVFVPCIQMDRVLPAHAGLNVRFNVDTRFAPLFVTCTSGDMGAFKEQWEFDSTFAQAKPGYVPLARAPVSSAKVALP